MNFNETDIINQVLTFIQGAPNAFSFLTLAMITLTGYLFSLACMRCLKQRFGNVEEGLTDKDIKDIIEEERQRRAKLNSFKSGSAAPLSEKDEQDIQKRLNNFKDKINSLAESKKKGE